MTNEKFNGALEKYLGWEGKFVHYFEDKIPAWIETHHLTCSTIIWSLLVVFFSYLATENIHWLWGASAAIILQYLTDLFDGAIGRKRGTGLVRWGFYMDHFLDYVFLCAILIGYSLFIPASDYLYLFFILAAFGSFMVNSYLSFAATSKFKIVYMGIGPTAVRFAFIAINTLIILFGKTHLVAGLPYVLALSVVSLIVVVYRTQKEIWLADEENKGEKI